MARYIDAENMYKEVLKRSTSPLNEWDTCGVLNVLDMVKTEDVAPVVHAHWINTIYAENGYFMGVCSYCFLPNIVNSYCGYCGAKMDEEDL